MPAPVFNQAAYTSLLQRQREQKLAQLDAQSTLYDYEDGLTPLRYASTNAQRGVLGAQSLVTDARARANGVQRMKIGADGRVISAQEGMLPIERSLITLGQSQLAEQTADVAALRSARGNVADKVAVTREAQGRGVENSRIYAKTGTAAPSDVDVQPGQEGLVGLGQRATLKTQEDIVRGKNADNAEDRGLVMKGAQLAHDMAQTNVTQAELEARKVGLTLAEANLMVEDAQNNVSRAQNASSNADLDLREAGIEGDRLQNAYGRAGNDLARLGVSREQMMSPQDEGYELYRDPYTRNQTWLTPAEADSKQYDYSSSLTRQRIPTELATAEERRKQQEAITKSQPQHPMKFFDDSDYIMFLVPGVPGDPKNLDPSQPSESRLLDQVREGIRAKYPGISDAAVETKAQQYLDAARKERARLKDATAVEGKSRSR